MMNADAPRSAAHAAADATETDSAAGDFPTVLRGAIAASGLSLEEVRQRLAGHGVAVSIATLSYWQSGRSRPERASSLSAMGPLEEVLGVPRGALVGRLTFGGAARRSHTLDADRAARGERGAVPEDGPARTWPAAEEALALLGLDLGALRRRSVHDRIELGPNGERRRHQVRMVLTAERDRVASYPVWAEYEADGTTPPTVRGLVNARVGRMIPLVDHRGVAAEMLLPGPLSRGQSIVVEHELGLDDDTPWTGFARYVPDTLREAVIEVRFDPARLPATAEQVFEVHVPDEGGDEPDVVGAAAPTALTTPLNAPGAAEEGAIEERVAETVTPLTPGTPLTIVVTDADPGFHGLRWTW